jgi:hypothetical protein
MKWNMNTKRLRRQIASQKKTKVKGGCSGFTHHGTQARVVAYKARKSS